MAIFCLSFTDLFGSAFCEHCNRPVIYSGCDRSNLLETHHVSFLEPQANDLCSKALSAHCWTDVEVNMTTHAVRYIWTVSPPVPDLKRSEKMLSIDQPEFEEPMPSMVSKVLEWGASHSDNEII